MGKLCIDIQKSLKTQESYVEKIINEIKTLPLGSLYYTNVDAHIYYYHSTFRNGIRHRKYVSVRDGAQAQLIADLKRKRFLLGCKKVLEGNVVALRACLSKYEEFDPALISSQLAASYRKIIEVTNEVKNDETKNGAENNIANGNVRVWQNEPYPRAEMHEENLKHEAIGCLMVRSKSEALIAFALDLAHIPFHYEETLEFENKKIAPDFTILHPTTGERVYWEHFGMMDDPGYASETFKKLVLYGQNNIMPGKNLIYTIETNAEPLSIREIQGLIAYYLLA